MRVRSYDVLRRAVEEGIDCGWQRAHKHSDTPTADHIKDHIYGAVMNNIGEYFDFDDLATDSAFTPPGDVK